MNAIVKTRGLSKTYGDVIALDQVDLEIPAGKIVGLIGPNGAGKTTLLKCLLGLAPYKGEISVLGKDPIKQRTELLKEVCFIADTAILPRWMKVSQALDYVEGVHPAFNREQAQNFLDHTNINPNKRVQQLSKGMITQLHLALVMAINARLLILDEPTLGLDILYRKQFYSSLLDDYFDHERTILITTHQVEEIEALLTDLVFIKEGKLILDHSMEEFPSLYTQLSVHQDQAEQARALGPVGERNSLGGTVFIYEGSDRKSLQALGETSTPSISDLFVAKMLPQGEKS